MNILQWTYRLNWKFVWKFMFYYGLDMLTFEFVDYRFGKTFLRVRQFFPLSEETRFNSEFILCRILSPFYYKAFQSIRFVSYLKQHAYSLLLLNIFVIMDVICISDADRHFIVKIISFFWELFLLQVGVFIQMICFVTRHWLIVQATAQKRREIYEIVRSL